MPRLSVDKQTPTTSATKKRVDNGCLIWFITRKMPLRLWKSDQKGIQPAQTLREPKSRLSRCIQEEFFGGRRDGAEGRTRTGDLLITNQLLYQLSYFGLLLRLYRCACLR